MAISLAPYSMIDLQETTVKPVHSRELLIVRRERLAKFSGEDSSVRLGSGSLLSRLSSYTSAAGATEIACIHSRTVLSQPAISAAPFSCSPACSFQETNNTTLCAIVTTHNSQMEVAYAARRLFA